MIDNRTPLWEIQKALLRGEILNPENVCGCGRYKAASRGICETCFRIKEGVENDRLSSNQVSS